MSELLNGKIRKYIKILRKKKVKYTFREAYNLICSQIKQEEAFTEEEMESVREGVWTRLKENWPFEDVI